MKAERVEEHGPATGGSGGSETGDRLIDRAEAGDGHGRRDKLARHEGCHERAKPGCRPWPKTNAEVWVALGVHVPQVCLDPQVAEAATHGPERMRIVSLDCTSKGPS